MRDEVTVKLGVLGAKDCQMKIQRLADACLGRPLTIAEQMERLRDELAGTIDAHRLRWHLQDGRSVEQITLAVSLNEKALAALTEKGATT